VRGTLLQQQRAQPRPPVGIEPAHGREIVFHRAEITRDGVERRVEAIEMRCQDRCDRQWIRFTPQHCEIEEVDGQLVGPTMRRVQPLRLPTQVAHRPQPQRPENVQIGFGEAPKRLGSIEDASADRLVVGRGDAAEIAKPWRAFGHAARLSAAGAPMVIANMAAFPAAVAGLRAQPS
jgi:hypothetical protein